MEGGVDGGVVVHILYSLCTDNNLQSLIYCFIIAYTEFSGERRGGRFVHGLCGSLWGGRL